MIGTKTLNKIERFEINFDRNKCKKIFGENLGNHIWSKFLSSDGSIIKVYSHLDSKNRKKLASAIK